MDKDVAILAWVAVNRALVYLLVQQGARLKDLPTGGFTKGKRKRVHKHCRGMQSSSDRTCIEKRSII
jgi:hypothetical protein